MSTYAASPSGGQAQLSVEGFRAWLTTEELPEEFHLVNAAASLQHRVPISPALRLVHWVPLEEGVEHVC